MDFPGFFLLLYMVKWSIFGKEVEGRGIRGAEISSCPGVGCGNSAVLALSCTGVLP